MDMRARTKTVRDVDLKEKRVFVRVDFNVPLDENGKVGDSTRIVAALPTLKYLLDQRSRVILASHLGRPNGRANPKYSLRPVAEELAVQLGRPVQFVRDCVGPEVEAAAAALQPGSVLLLENVRFHAGEQGNDPGFAEKLGSLAEVYVNDAFGAAHRAHASTAGITHHVSDCVCGFLIERELAFLGEKTEHPARPFVVILGGAKVSDKIMVIDRLLEKADAILIGGAMAFTFDLAQGKGIGDSLAEPDKVGLARSILEKAGEKAVRLLLPVDAVVTDRLDFADLTVGELRVVQGEIEDGWKGVDIGPESVANYRREVTGAGTVLWNGPMGIFEIEACSKGTFAVADAVAENTRAVSIVGGGDSAKAIRKSGNAEKVTFISTGGGASLQFLEGRELPGVVSLDTHSS